jgi:PEP-CTERM motif
VTTRKTWLLAVAVLAVVALVAAVPVARADDFQLTVPNTGLAGFAGPYADITLTLLNSTQVQISITGDTFSGGQYFLGDGSTFAFNFSGTGSISLGSFSWTGGNASTAFSDGGSGTVDGFGNFTNTINDFDGATSAVTFLSFIVTDASGLSLADLENLNKDNFMFAGHIFACDTADIVNGSCTLAAVTGFAGNGTGTPPIPEPATLMTLGSGLLALGGFFRRRLGIGG